MIVIKYFILLLGIINLIRMSLFLVGSDLYGLYKHVQSRKRRPQLNLLPSMTIVIPAFNEERTILHTIKSVLASDYPQQNLLVVVVNDGSTDNTEKLVSDYTKAEQLPNVVVLTQENGGKASALNRALQEISYGELIMTLDADSYLSKNALTHVVHHFEDSRVSAVAANVKVRRGRGILNLIQRFEYLISYQMKKAHTIFNIEYIIGGVGATLRRSTLKYVDYFDDNTLTEDIDLTFKIIRQGNKENRVIYADDVVVYTEGVLSLEGLVRQRFRWKFGRSQTFWKNRKLFFNSHQKYAKQLTWVYLPYALFSDIAFSFEPIIIGYLLGLVILTHDFVTIVSAIVVITCYYAFNIFAEETLTFKEKLTFTALAPFIYFLFYLLSYVEYVALLKTFVRLKKIPASLKVSRQAWVPVERARMREV